MPHRARRLPIASVYADRSSPSLFSVSVGFEMLVEFCIEPARKQPVNLTTRLGLRTPTSVGQPQPALWLLAPSIAPARRDSQGRASRNRGEHPSDRGCE